MVNKYTRLLYVLDAVTDFVMVFLAYVLSSYLAVIVNPGFDTGNTSMQIIPFALVFSFLFMFLYMVSGVYNGSWTFSRRARIQKIILINALALAIVSFGFYLAKMVDYSRSFLLVFYFVSTALVSLKHYTEKVIIFHLRKNGFDRRSVVVIGSGRLAEQYVNNVRANSGYGYHIYGSIGDKELRYVKYLGSVSDIDSILSDTAIDEVVVCPEVGHLDEIDTLIGYVEKAGIPCSIIPSFNNSLSERVAVGILGDMKVISLRSNPLDNPVNAFVKRTEDIVLSLILILLSSPFMVIAAIGVRLSSPGPIFFRQERVGYHRKNFKMLKFRSMRINSTSDTAWSTGVDNRRTKFGSFIRKTSLDELPQFFNVLKGDMSVIGPRPEIPHFVDEFKESIPKYMVKHQVKPGITGWAQVNGYRGDTSIVERISHDIYYIEHWSVWLDIKIIFMTVFGGMINKEKL